MSPSKRYITRQRATAFGFANVTIQSRERNEIAEATITTTAKNVTVTIGTADCF